MKKSELAKRLVKLEDEHKALNKEIREIMPTYISLRKQVRLLLRQRDRKEREIGVICDVLNRT